MEKISVQEAVEEPDGPCRSAVTTRLGTWEHGPLRSRDRNGGGEGVDGGKGVTSCLMGRARPFRWVSTIASWSCSGLSTWEANGRPRMAELVEVVQAPSR